MEDRVKSGAAGPFVAGGDETDHLPGRAKLAQDENDGELGSEGVIGCTIDRAQEAKNGILVNS
jgi:hypothetical protein